MPSLATGFQLRRITFWCYLLGCSQAKRFVPVACKELKEFLEKQNSLSSCEMLLSEGCLQHWSRPVLSCGQRTHAQEAWLSCYRWLGKLNQLDTAWHGTCLSSYSHQSGILLVIDARSSSAGEARPKEAWGSTVIHLCLCLSCFWKSSWPVDKKDVHHVQLHRKGEGICWGSAELAMNCDEHFLLLIATYTCLAIYTSHSDNILDFIWPLQEFQCKFCFILCI